ncbi:autotransporter domain-containing protein [Mesorhizobium sp. BAC0120]|uniref:autotransporter domain-containing protein n=1 Tax=Mesorhizobium sp. BAC0120 TaxID=3090670 RepID=UPI00298CAE50|nr:autotransporter domain-containing protein [Mesorhizobium sp. BAC0120]MDW6024724.1 autotransporter domain-containing protein [Mesorhizobium sp. BAC0120]
MRQRVPKRSQHIPLACKRQTKALLWTGVSLIAMALAAPAGAETIIYTDGQTATAPVAMTSDTELNLAAGTATQSGIVSGDFHVTKTGYGLLILDGVNTYTGGTTVSRGTLFAGNTSALGTGAVELASGAALSLGAPGTFTNNININLGASLSSGFGARHAGVISGDGLLSLSAAGNVIRIAGNNTYRGGTNISAGEVLVENDHALGTNAVNLDATLGYADGISIGNDVMLRTAGSTLSVETGSAVQRGGIAGNAAGSSLTKIGAGELVLTGASTYSGDTHVVEGTLTGGVGYTFSGQSLYSLESGAATLRIRAHQRVGGISGTGILDLGDYNLETGGRNVAATFEGTLVGSANSSISKKGTSSLTFEGNNSAYGGSLYVDSGSAFVDGDYRNMRVSVGDGVFGGTGRVGAVTVDGGTLFGSEGQQLTMQSLALGADSRVSVRLGTSSTQALFNVAGNLTLDGRLDVEDAGGFGPGVYRLFDYGGTLTNNGLEIGTVPSGYDSHNLNVQTAMAGQVNLVAADAGYGPVLFWDGDDPAHWDNGKIDGGDGQWRTGGRAFTDAQGMKNGAMNPRPGFVVFGGSAGNVEVYTGTGQIETTGMQFATSGYKLYGDLLTLAAGEAIIRVGDGTAAGANYVATISNHLDGGGRLTKTDLGTLILDGDNTYWGGTEIRQGTLQIGSGGASGSIVGDVVNDGVLAFNRSDATTFDGAISGTGAVHLLDGDLTLTGINRYTGGTIVDGGILRAGQERAFVSDTAFTVNGGTLDLNDYSLIMSSLSGTGGSVAIGTATLSLHQNIDTSFAGSLTGSGWFTKGGSGKLILSGDSGGFTGETNVEKGTLVVNGVLGGTVTVLGARLEGVGTIGDTLVKGMIAPGNSIGTLNVGNITFDQGSIYEVEVNAAGKGDRIIASGNATIGGGTVKVLAGMGNYASQTKYNILTANGGGGITGTFDGVTSNLAFLDPSLSYESDSVWLTMSRNSTSFQNVGVTANQIATGGGVESLGFGNPVYDAVLSLSADQAQYAFDQLSGETHSSAKTALIEDSRFVRNAVNDRIRAAFDGVGASGTVTTYVDGRPVTVKANTDRFAIWAQGFGSWGHTNGDGNAARLNRSTGGFFVGADAPAFDTWRFGAVTGYSRTKFDVKDRRSAGSSDNYHVGLYGGTAWGDLAFRTGAAYTWHDISTSRNVIFPGFDDSLKSDYNAATAQVFGELAYGFNVDAARFEPFADLAYVNLHTYGFTERGGAAALTSPSSNTDATFTTLGLRASTSFEVGGSTLTAKGVVGWRHAFGDVTPLSTMSFAGGGDTFSIGGVPIARNAAVIEAGLDYAIMPNATLGVTYGGQFGSGMADQSVNANFNVKF